MAIRACHTDGNELVHSCKFVVHICCAQPVREHCWHYWKSLLFLIVQKFAVLSNILFLQRQVQACISLQCIALHYFASLVQALLVLHVALIHIALLCFGGGVWVRVCGAG